MKYRNTNPIYGAMAGVFSQFVGAQAILSSADPFPLKLGVMLSAVNVAAAIALRKSHPSVAAGLAVSGLAMLLAPEFKQEIVGRAAAAEQLRALNAAHDASAAAFPQ